VCVVMSRGGVLCACSVQCGGVSGLRCVVCGAGGQKEEAEEAAAEDEMVRGCGAALIIESAYLHICISAVIYCYYKLTRTRSNQKHFRKAYCKLS
jgi:hypothetical protein